MDAIVLAGGLPGPGDPLYRECRGGPKALIDINGRPMVAWVLRALQACPDVEEVTVVGLPGKTPLATARPVAILPDAGSLVENVLAGIHHAQKRHPAAQALLVTTADIPLLTPAMLAQFVAACRPFDRLLYYPYVTRQSMEHRFPGSRRTYARLGSQEVAGGDLALLRPEIAQANPGLFQALVQARKAPWKMARVLGLPFLWRLLTHRLTVEGIETHFQRLLGHPVQAVPLRRAELAMDVDKPGQLALVRAELAVVAAQEEVA